MNVPPNRNIANTMAIIQSKSVHSRKNVASVSPIPANASAMNTLAGTANTAHQESRSPKTAMATTNIPT